MLRFDILPDSETHFEAVVSISLNLRKLKDVDSFMCSVAFEHVPGHE